MFGINNQVIVYMLVTRASDFRFKKSNFPFQKKLNSVSIPFHHWQR